LWNILVADGHCREMNDMKLFRSKMWSPVEIVCLKLSAILFGMIAGAYFPEFTKQYVLIFVVIALILAIKPAHSYFRD
jgi:uncharacterized ion transporter superfamily protein YfcC